MFKAILTFIAAAGLLAACGTTQSERIANAEKRSKETVHIICKQSDSIIFEDNVIDLYVLNSGVQGTTADGAEFLVNGAACVWKANPNVSKN